MTLDEFNNAAYYFYKVDKKEEEEAEALRKAKSKKNILKVTDCLEVDLSENALLPDQTYENQNLYLGRFRPVVDAPDLRNDLVLIDGRFVKRPFDSRGREFETINAINAIFIASASYAVDSCIRAVDILASAAGTTASQLDGPWPRLQADVRSVGQHFMVGPQQMQIAGQVLLGQPSDDPGF